MSRVALACYYKIAMHCGGPIGVIAAVAIGAWASIYAHCARAQPVSVPIVQRPHEHEAVQFGYAPWYVCNVPAFDSHNRPYLRSRMTDPHATGFVHVLQDGRWVRRDFAAAVRRAYPDFDRFHDAGGTLGAHLTFDADDHLYTLVRIQLSDGTGRELLLYSTDLARTFAVYELPRHERVDAKPIGFANLESRAGHNRLTRPPLVALLQNRADHPLGKWTAHYNLLLLQPTKRPGGLSLGEPIPVTDRALYMSRHAGNPSFAVSGPEKTYIVWAETTPTDGVPGVPTFVATFDPQARAVSDRQFVGHGYPPNNGHNSPGIVLDDKGYLHTLTGSHGASFLYSRSLQPYSTAAGMTEPIPALQTGWLEQGRERGRQTYLSFACDHEGTLHAVFRQWIQGTAPWFQGSYFGGLAHHRKLADQPWQPRAQLLVVPPLDGYSIYYQNLTVDRRGRLFVSYGYRSDQVHYGTAEAENHYCALLMSDDGGENWRLATTEDFARGLDTAADDGRLSPAELAGIVTDSAGRPVAHAIVSIGPVTRSTDAQGRYRIESVLADEVTVVVQATGFALSKIELDFEGQPQRRLDWQLSAAPEAGSPSHQRP